MPSIEDKLREDLKEYMFFRKDVCRKCDKKILLYFIELYAENKSDYNKIKTYIEESIEKDRASLESIKKHEWLKTADFKELKKNVNKYSLTFGKLLYSFDENIRDETKNILYKLHLPGLSFAGNKDEENEAKELLERSIQNYDPYAPYFKGKNRIIKFGMHLYTNMRLLQRIKLYSNLKIKNKETPLKLYKGEKEMLDIIKQGYTGSLYDIAKTIDVKPTTALSYAVKLESRSLIERK